MQKVLELIRTDVAEERIRIDNPTQNLESYFLDVVAKARQGAAETSGATSGGRVAAYLRGGADDRPAAERILERLTLPAAAKEPEPATATEPAVNQARLEALTQPAEPTPASSAPALAK